MGFFAGRPRMARSGEDAGWSALPEWFEPPRGVLPGYAPTRAVVFRTDEAILVVGRFDVYPTGAEFTIELQLRSGDDDLTDIPWELHHRHHTPDGALPDDLIRLGVVFADGRSWSNIDSTHPATSEPPPAPFVISRGGGGAGDGWAMNQWLWPLPPDGPLTFIAEWPKYGIGESRATVDGGAIRAAAERAEQLWTR